MASLLSRIQLPPTPPFKRPRDLVYASDERPPGLALWSLSIQHIATALALIAYVLAAGHIGGLDIESTRKMVTATLICMAVTSVMQSWGGKFGAGLLLVQAPTSLAVPIAGLVISQYGAGGMVVVGLMYALLGLIVSFLLPHIRALLPPMVAGIVLVLAGLALITPALVHTGIRSAGSIDGVDLLIGAVTLTTIVVLSVWGKQQSKLLSVLIGIIAGAIVAALFGRLHGLALLEAEPVFGLPHFPTPAFDLSPGGYGALAVLALMSQLGTFACLVLMHKMNDADWRRTDVRMAGRGLRTNAVGNFIAAWLGGYPCTTSSTNVAVNHISHSTSRWVGILTGALIAIAAFLPQVTLALTLAPVAIIGAVELYAAAYLIVSGIRLISSRAMDSRGIFTVGLSIVAGTAIMLVPDLAGSVPESIRFIFRSGVVVGGIASIVLNLVFRLGVSRSARLAVTARTDEPRPRSSGEQVVDFIEEHGANWGARQEAITLAAQAALEATEAIAAAGDDREVIEVRGSFDEFNLVVELAHTGAPLDLNPRHGVIDANLLDADDDAFETALDSAVAGISHALLSRLADRITSGRRGENAYLRLHFDH